jgi:predicted HTH transcriptional regulator
MTIKELQRLVATGEGLQIEFKRRVPEPERITKELIALANTQGGKLLIGVDDDGSIKGLRDADEETFALETALTQHCDPPIPYQIEIVPVQHRRDVVVVHVPNSAAKPHFLIQTQPEPSRTAYVRVADKSIEASREMVRLMRNEHIEKDIQFEFGDKERRLLEYLDRYEKITLDQFMRLVNVPRKSAAQTLFLLVKADMLAIHPNEQADFYTLAPQ